jgi:hypothetical protein
LVFELAKRRVRPVPSEWAAYRALVRAGMIDPSLRDRRSRKWKRWERGAPMELWQMDVVGGFALADGTHAKALTGIDDHSRMCVCARLMARERSLSVWDGTLIGAGTSVDFQSADFIRVVDHKTAEHWDTINAVRMYESFGLLPSDAIEH